MTECSSHTARPGRARLGQVDTQDVQRWVVWLLRHCSETYAYQQYHSLQQFFRWLAAEEEIADPMARLRAPKWADKPVPFFHQRRTFELDRACQGSTFAQRRDAAILAVLRATGIRLAELTGIRYHPDDPGHSDVDLQRREIYIRGKRGKDRIVRIDHLVMGD
jgi:site-specific recombinase XerD